MKTSGRAECRVQKHAGTFAAGTDWLSWSEAGAWLYRRTPAPTSRPPSCEVPAWDLRRRHTASVTLWVPGRRRGPPAAAAAALDVTPTQHRLKKTWSLSVNLEKNLLAVRPFDPPPFPFCCDDNNIGLRVWTSRSFRKYCIFGSSSCDRWWFWFYGWHIISQLFYTNIYLFCLLLVRKTRVLST